MRIVGITGLARSGKDTGAGFIKEWANDEAIPFERHGFADLLKLSAARALGLVESEPVEKAIEFCNELKTHGSLTITLDPAHPEREYTISGREFLQWYGTEAHRKTFSEEFWVEALFDNILPHGPDDPRFGSILVIPDCRFVNEAKAILDHGGEVWEVTREDSGVANGLEVHVSEYGLPDGIVEYSIQNDGTLAEFRRRIQQACEFNLKEKK